PANHARQQESGWNKAGQIGEACPIAMIVQEASARGALEPRDIHARKNREAWGPTYNEAWHREAFPLQFTSQGKNGFDLLVHRGRALNRALLVIVAVVDVNSSGAKTGEPLDPLVKRQCFLAGCNSGAMLAYVDIKQNVDLLLGRSDLPRKRLQEGR